MSSGARVPAATASSRTVSHRAGAASGDSVGPTSGSGRARATFHRATTTPTAMAAVKKPSLAAAASASDWNAHQLRAPMPTTIAIATT